MIDLPNSLDELLIIPPKKPITSVLKRDDSTPVKFDILKIAEAVGKSSVASGRNYTPEETEKFAYTVKNKLEFCEGKFQHSECSIPNVEDVQDVVLDVFDETNAKNIANILSERMDIPYNKVYPIVYDIIKGKYFDPTGTFYEEHMKGRTKVRQRLCDLLLAVDVDSTDKQLLLSDVYNGNSHRFNAGALIKFVLEKTGVPYEDAVFAVKKTQEFLVSRGSDRPVQREELIMMIDASLTEKGHSKDNLLSGRNLSLSLDDVKQIIYSKSVENSNIQTNNPEAVNLGIVELVLKELALRDIFDPDIAEAHRNGIIHIHDLGYPTRVYCSAHSIEYIKKFGLDVLVANLDAKSSQATKPRVLNNHIHTFLAAIQAYYAGALGFPMVNTLYGPILLRDVEVVGGYELMDNQKIPRRIERKTLEELIKDGTIKGFIEEKSSRILKLSSKEELKEIAQNLIFGASQSAFSRGGQTLFIDFNIDLGVPDHMVNVPALFPKAEYVRAKQNENGEWGIIERTKKELERHHGLVTEGEHGSHFSTKNGDVIQPEDGTLYITYGHPLVKKAAADFAEAMLEIFEEGDRYGNIFNFPKCDVHVGRETFEDEEQKKLLMKACEVVEKNDSVYFMFDRGDGMNVAQCCRLRERITDPEILKYPERMRFCGFQNVSINLPQVGFRVSGGTLEEKLSSATDEIDKTMLLALRAHTNKRRYIQKLLDKEGAPMRAMGRASDDGNQYIDLDKSTYIFGIVGLNELVQTLTGKELHEDVEAYKIGLKVLSHIYSLKNLFTLKYGMKFVIEETPGESANRRLAKIDQFKYPEKAKKVLKGSIEADEVYYTNSSHLRPDAPVSGLDRAILQSKMNPLIEAGAITHLFTGEKQNKRNAVYDFVEAMFHNTQSSQIVFSGEHTICLECSHHERGLLDRCTKCGNDNPERISQKTRVVGYNSDPRKWNKSKVGELKSRQRAQEFYRGEKDSLNDLESALLSSIIEPDKIRFGVIGTPSCMICSEVENRIKKYIERKIPDEIKGRIEVVKYNTLSEDGAVFAAIYNAPLDNYPTVIVHKGDRFTKKISEYPYNKKPIIVTTGDIDRMYKEITNSS